MAIQLTDLKDLPPEQIESMFLTLSQLVQERHPEVELTRGVFHDLVLYFTSVLNATMQENIDRVLQSNSLQRIKANPSLADDEIVDQVLSNYNLTRDPGAPATGLVTVVSPFDSLVTISPNINLRPEGGEDVVFSPTTTFRLLASTATATSDNERVLARIADGTYIATIPVTAKTVGRIGNVARNTRMRPDFMPNNVSDMYATEDFVTGRDPATNEEYISRLAPALAAKTIGGRQSYVSTIRAQAPFDEIRHISIIGAGDAEQHRDQHGLFPISGGGKVDVYIQSHAYAKTRRYFLEATYVGPGTIGSRWQISLGRDLASGLYEFLRVAGPEDDTSNGYEIISEMRGVDLSNLDFVPSIKYRHEGAYTRYQIATIQFDDTDKSILNLIPQQSKAIYAVDVALMSYVAEVQDFITDRDRRSRTTDVLVRGAIPCFTNISFQIRKNNNDLDPDFVAIRTAVSEKVAEVGFTGQLHASQIAAAVQQLLPGNQALSAIDMLGRIRKPDGQYVYIRDNTLLRIPENPQHLVSGRTTVFLTRPGDVSISTVVAGFAG